MVNKLIVALVAAALSAALTTHSFAQQPLGYAPERVAPSIEGGYWSKDFKRGSVGMLIQGIDENGRVKGFIGGTVHTCAPGRNCKKGNWRYLFGVHGTATFRDGSLYIRMTSDDGSIFEYRLQYNGGRFVGTYDDPWNPNKAVSFSRS
jgi:hypothetical protein